MGSVHLGRRAGSGYLVAVKTVRRELCEQPGYRQRFAREIEAAQAVQSVYTPRVIDADPDGDPPWLATEFISGPNLAEHLAGHGPLPEGHTRVLTACLAEALAGIHAAGIVHRDIKPANIILAEAGPRIVDFGIARVVAADGLTSTGVLAATRKYASPEQILGQEAGPPSDMFSLGIVVAEAMGAGVHPGDGQPVAVRVIDGAPPELSGMPEDLRGLAARCLARVPTARPEPAAVSGALGPLPLPQSGGHRWQPGPPPASPASYPSGPPGAAHTAPAPVRPGTTVDPAAATAGSVRPPAPVTPPPGPAGPFTGHPGNAGPPPSSSAVSGPAAARRRLPMVLGSAVALAAVVAGGTLAYGALNGSGSPGGGPQAPAPEPPEFTAGALGTSRYQGPGDYWAEVTSVQQDGHTVTFGLKARGAEDLRPPQSSCLEVDGPDGTFTVAPHAWRAGVEEPGAFEGELTFPLLVSGSYAFRYSCRGDYPALPAGEATVPSAGVSRHGTGRYFAVALSVDRTAEGTEILFGAAGPPDLREPGTSCITTAGDGPVRPRVALDRADTDLTAFYLGTMTFDAAPEAGLFTYSCLSDYTGIPLPPPRDGSS